MPQPKTLSFRDVWATIPYLLVAGRSPLQQAILLHIAHMNLTRDGDEQPSHSTLANLCGVSDSTLQTAASLLEEEGVIVILRKPGEANRYLLADFVSEVTNSGDQEGPVGAQAHAQVHAHTHAHTPAGYVRSRSSLYSSRNYVTQLVLQEHTQTHCASPEIPKEDGVFLDPESIPSTKPTVQWIVEKYAEIASRLNLPSIRNVTPSRKMNIARRIREIPTKDEWQKMFDRLAVSPHLAKESWFSFSFIIESSDNFEKVANGWMDWKKSTMDGRAPNKLAEDTDFLTQLTEEGRKHAL